MSESRYSELKYDGKVYTEQWQIDEILIKNKFNWMVNAEIKNARLEIFQDTLVWNAGIWYNGDWYFGVWRDGEWRSGTWQNGVWYNGVWRNGTFKSGIIYKGNFFKGKMESGEIRGGKFVDMIIDPSVVEYTDDEYQETQQETQPIEGEPTTNPDKVVVHTSTPEPIEVQPKIQKEGYNMKNSFKLFLEYNDIDDLSRSELIDQIYNGSRYELEELEEMSDKELDDLYYSLELDDDPGYDEYYADEWHHDRQMENKKQIIDMKRIKTFETFANESVGELEDSFININIDETDLEVSEKPSGNLKQKAGKVIIENPSKAEAYNAIMRQGGEVFQEKGFSDKQIHHVNSTK